MSEILVPSVHVGQRGIDAVIVPTRLTGGKIVTKDDLDNPVSSGHHYYQGQERTFEDIHKLFLSKSGPGRKSRCDREIVVEIRNSYWCVGASRKSLSQMYSLSPRTIDSILSGHLFWWAGGGMGI